MIHDVVMAEYLDGYRIRVTFDNGREGIIDFTSCLDAGGVFERSRDSVFQSDHGATVTVVLEA